MDILYISPKTRHELTQYCENELLFTVMDHFAKNGKIIEKTDIEHPNRLWIITDYISNHTIDQKKKLAVILSFASLAGLVQIGDRQELGETNVLCMLKELHYISDDDFDYYVERFFNFSQGHGVKFS